jgi:hypothetical protein
VEEFDELGIVLDLDEVVLVFGKERADAEVLVRPVGQGIAAVLVYRDGADQAVAAERSV